MSETQQLHVLGIRHHGPGSARSVERALRRIEPDVVLIEGPPEGDALTPYVLHAEMQPPVALLVYRPDAPRYAVYYPFAEFSPEWRALRFAAERGVPARFIDLSMAHHLAAADDSGNGAESPNGTEPPAGGTAPMPGLDAGTEPDPEAAAVAGTDADTGGSTPDATALRGDPLGWLAEAAGYEDAERLWEHLVEHRRGDDEAIFIAVAGAMAELREAVDERWGKLDDASRPAPMVRDREREQRREAQMRQGIRTAMREGFERIAVVCGAWHAPALLTMPPATRDAALLKGLPRVKVEATWVPWTNGRLCAASGYGAGIESPGWYHHLWTAPDRVAERWMARVATLLRDEDLDASSAQLIDAARLAETLAALRGRTLAGLSELTEATRSVLCFGNDAPLQLIARKLVVGEALGSVPADAPTVPLQQDLSREQRRLRLPPEAVERSLDLDLRKENDLARSRLLHRLALLGVPWGSAQRGSGQQRGTFHELWTLQWRPEFAVALIEAATWGNTVTSAASARAVDQAREANVPGLTALLDQAILADLGDAVPLIVQRLQDESARAPDLAHLMDGLPSLASVLRYSDVRRTDAGTVAQVLDGFIVRICVGLGAACASLNDEAAAAMRGRIEGVHGAIALSKNDEHSAMWTEALRRIADADQVHGLVSGRSVRLLFDAGGLEADDVARRVSLALSAGEDPARGAAWIEGLLAGSAVLLLHDEALWRVLDQWLVRLPNDAFTAVLPLLRRTFSPFAAPERRQLGERVRRAPAIGVGSGDADAPFDHPRAEAALRTALALLGVEDASRR